VTLTRHNFPFIEELLGILEAKGVEYIRLQDLRPFGTKDVYDNMRLTIEQERQLYETVCTAKQKYPSININTSELFVFSKENVNGKIMQCPAGDNFGYIDFYGDIYPCTSLPSFRMGNLLGNASLSKLWQSSDAIVDLRRIKDMPLERIDECGKCTNRSYCDGGCRGDALFYCNDLFGLPSRCPKRLGIVS
jgi:radical SAM protein with 4Fe4S-binding SPASM domain